MANLTQFLLSGLVVLPGVIGVFGADRKTKGESPVFVVLYERGPTWQVDKDLREQPGFAGHIDYLYTHAAQILADGPFLVEPTDRIIGLVVYQARDREEAERCVAEDPGTRSGIFKATVRQWRVNRMRAFDPAKPTEN